MNKIDLNILMLEDEPLDAELNKEQLALLEEYNCKVTVVADKESYLKSLNTSLPDIILSDYNLPQYNGYEALYELLERKLLIPFIFVTGTMHEEVAADAIKAGAWDYVVKDRLFRLPLAIKSVLKIKEEREIALQAEKKAKTLVMAIEQTSTQIIVTDKNSNIEYVNKTFTDITDFRLEEVIGKPVSILDSGDEDVNSSERIKEKLASGEVYKGETLSRKKDGSNFWELVSITPIRNIDNEITNFVIVKEDITNRKNMEEALIQALEKAEKSDKLKEAFLQNLSHEIRTPMNAICGFSALLRERLSTDKEDLKYFSSIVEKNGKQLLSIVSDVLTMSRIETGNEKIVLKSTDIHALINELYEILKPKAFNKSLVLTIKNENIDRPLNIITDRAKLVQILTNILENAIKFTAKGSVELEYSINKNFLDFKIKDTGIGISEESKEIIFERFRQADSTISVHFGGTGLGLSISKSYAEMLGGDLNVESEKGKGSTFILRLPLNEEKGIKLTKQPTNKLLNRQPITILIAEDEINNYELLRALLETETATLIHAPDGEAAVKLFKEYPNTDLILMDIKMPVMDGITCFNEIRKINPKIPVIAQTAYALEQDREELAKIGFSDYLSKPIKKDDLFSKINTALSF